MLDNGVDATFERNLEQYFQNKEYAYEREVVDGYIRYSLPSKSKRSTMEGFVVYINDFLVQVYVFDLVRGVEKNKTNLDLLNHVNSENNFWKFTIDNDETVNAACDLLNSDLDTELFLNLLLSGIDVIDNVFDKFMKARYS